MGSHKADPDGRKRPGGIVKARLKPLNQGVCILGGTVITRRTMRVDVIKFFTEIKKRICLDQNEG